MNYRCRLLLVSYEKDSDDGKTIERWIELPFTPFPGISLDNILHADWYGRDDDLVVSKVTWIHEDDGSGFFEVTFDYDVDWIDLLDGLHADWKDYGST